jgi:hypothetical protein
MPSLEYIGVFLQHFITIYNHQSPGDDTGGDTSRNNQILMKGSNPGPFYKMKGSNPGPSPELPPIKSHHFKIHWYGDLWCPQGVATWHFIDPR